MIANTYVVKPFGISEVKVIALKGEPGGPTQEQVNTAVEEYMDDHPEAQIPDGAVTTEKLASNAVAPYADNLVSSSYVSDSEPYLIRKTFAGVREDDELVGGSVVFNQLQTATATTETLSGVTFTNNGDGTWTANGTATAQARKTLANSQSVTGHVVLITGSPSGGSTTTYCLLDNLQSDGNKYDSGNGRIYRVTNSNGRVGVKIQIGNGYTASNIVFRPQVFDLTLMFGSSIADYILSLETATAGAGVAFFRSLFSKPYYAYNAGTLMSVNTSAHKMVGYNQFDGELEEGGINSSTGQNIVNANQRRSKNYIPAIPNTTYYHNAQMQLLFYDAEKNFIIARSGGALTAREFTTPSNCYFIRFVHTALEQVTDTDCINLSDPSKNGTYEPYTAHSYPLSSTDLRGIPTIVDGKLKYDGDVYKSDGTVTRLYGYRAYQSGDESLANAITDGTHTVYKLTTATTETADPFVNPQVCYPDGTEEYIDTRDVPIPVGHNTKYMRDLKKLLEGIPDAPSANGTYVLKATVSSSGVTYAWIAG